MDSITWEAPEGWRRESNHYFIDRNFGIIKSKLLKLNKPQSDYFYLQDGLNPFMYESAEYDEYFNNCQEAKEWQYPVLNIVINNFDLQGSSQDHIEFLRTKEGYKLISITIRSEILK